MLLEIGVRPIEIWTLQRVYRYITKVNNMPNHRLPHLAWNVGCKLQKNLKRKILSSDWVVHIRKWFWRWGVDDLLELLDDATHYIMYEERLVESLRMKWEDCKRTKVEYYIANVNNECWTQYKAKRLIDHIQPYLITNMSSNARGSLTLLRTRSHKLGIKAASWYQNVMNLKACKVCNEGMVEDECHSLFTCSTYSAIRARYDDILRGNDNLSAIRHHREGWAHMCMPYSCIETLSFNVWILFFRNETHIKNTCIL